LRPDFHFIEKHVNGFGFGAGKILWHNEHGVVEACRGDLCLHGRTCEGHQADNRQKFLNRQEVSNRPPHIFTACRDILSECMPAHEMIECGNA